jgi:hypothetical protein
MSVNTEWTLSIATDFWPLLPFLLGNADVMVPMSEVFLKMLPKKAVS